MPIKAGILHPTFPDQESPRTAEACLDETVSLATALGFATAFKQVVRLRSVNGATLFGSGRCDSLKREIDAANASAAVVNGSISAVQQRNLERLWDVRVLDRTGLILEIFASRAKTREGVLQVELAQLEYLKSRLVRRWTHLERQRGALGFVGGSGETQIESDRRAIDDRIIRVKRRLLAVRRTRGLHRSARKAVPYPTVALVGYTNAGKSTLFNRLTGAEVWAGDALFATLDPTMRLVTLPSGRQAVFSDTVGFISDLPTQLVAAFRATLEEVTNADIVVHVRDLTHPEFDSQVLGVNEVLRELNVDPADSRRVVQAWNKIDLLATGDREDMLTGNGCSQSHFPVSAISGDGLDHLLGKIDELLRAGDRTETVLLSCADGKQRAWLFGERVVQNETLRDECLELKVCWSDAQAARFRNRFGCGPGAGSVAGK